MVVNRFMRPAVQPVQSQYVPIPFDALLKAGAVTQQRYEQAMTAEQGIEDLLSSAKGLDYVETLSQGRVAASGQERVNREIDKFRNKLGALQKENPDITGMEYMTGLRTIYNGLKRSMNTGILGREAANYATAQEIYKKRSENPDIMVDPSLASALDAELLGYAKTDDLDYSPLLSSSMPVGKYVDLGKEVDDTVSGIKSTLMQEGFTGSGLDAYERWVKEKGIGVDRVLNLAAARMSEPKIANTIARRAQWAAMQEGDMSQKNVEKHARNIQKDLLTQMTSKYVSKDRVDKFLRTKALGKGKDKFNGLFARDLMMRTDGVFEDFDVSSVMSEVIKSDLEIYKTLKNKKAFMLQKGIAEGSTKGADGEDYSSALKLFDEGYKDALNTSSTKYDMLMQGMKEAGFEKEDIEKAKELLAEGSNMGVFYGNMDEKLAKERGKNLWEVIANSSAELINSAVRGTGDIIRGGARQWFETKNKIDDTRFRKIMKEKYGPKSVPINLNAVDKDISNIYSMTLKGTAPNYENSRAGVTDLKTGKLWGEDEFSEYDVDQADLAGWVKDPDKEGEYMLVYDVPSRSEDGKGTTVKTTAPKNFDLYLKSKGYDEDFNRLVEGQLYDKLKGVVRQNYSSSSKPTTVSIGSGENEQTFEVYSPLMTGSYWKVKIPAVDANGNATEIEKEANSMGDAVKIMKAARKALALDLLKKKDEKKKK